MNDARLAIGANFPPDPLDPETINSGLSERQRELVERVSDIDGAIQFGKLPAAISSEEEAERVAEFTVQCRKADQEAVKALKIELEPYAGAVEAVKGFFGNLRKRIQDAREAADNRILAWNSLKREKAAAEAWRPQAGEAMVRYMRMNNSVSRVEVDRLRLLNFIDAAGAVRAPGLAAKLDYEEAQALATARAAAVAKAAIEGRPAPAPPPPPAPAPPPPPPPPNSTVRSSRGATASERVTWKPVVVDEALVPRIYCDVSTVKLNAALRMAPKDKDGKPILEIPGVEIQEHRGITGRG